MIFDALYESAVRGELLLVAGGMCRFHIRRDRQLTIREIISTRSGAGSEMLARLKLTPGVVCIVARCPAHLTANRWWEKKGFALRMTLRTQKGTEINEWELRLP